MKKKLAKIKPINIRMTEEEHGDIKAIADKKNVYVSELLRHIIGNYVVKNKYKG